MHDTLIQGIVSRFDTMTEHRRCLANFRYNLYAFANRKFEMMMPKYEYWGHLCTVRN